jgi:nitrite reductase/ring-hydroxylating ferredoxin subunit
MVRAADLAAVRAKGVVVAQVSGHTLALFAQGDAIYAVDNRCPHMGFPLAQGSVCDGLLTCHWHHARFDLKSGGTFDPWADDLRSFPVEIRDGEVWVDVTPPADQDRHQRERLQVGLERDIPLVLAKASLALLETPEQVTDAFRIGLLFGVRTESERGGGWEQGLTMHTCFMNLWPHLDAADRPRALYHGLAAVARDSAGRSTHWPMRPMPADTGDLATLKQWFRQFVGVRDAEGAERCVVSAVRLGATPAEMADMLFAAVTDYRYIGSGHMADFTNKAFEALDAAGWEHAEIVLPSLVSDYAAGARMEESNAWRHPIDLVAILHAAFDQLPGAVADGKEARRQGRGWQSTSKFTATLLGDDPQAIADSLLAALRQGGTLVQVAQAVSYAAALRIARFHTSNEFPDWDTALHTFTFANAIEQGLRRTPSIDLLRGVFDAAMSIYTDRFLNMPPARLPEPGAAVAGSPLAGAAALLAELPELLNRQQQVDRTGNLVAQYLYSEGDRQQLIAMLGHLLLREDRNFHTIQMVEAAVQQVEHQQNDEAALHILVAATRYLTAHAPTLRSQGQTFQSARRLHQGEEIFAEA